MYKRQDNDIGDAQAHNEREKEIYSNEDGGGAVCTTDDGDCSGLLLGEVHNAGSGQQTSAHVSTKDTELSGSAQQQALGVGDQGSEVGHGTDAQEDQRGVNAQLDTHIKPVSYTHLMCIRDSYKELSIDDKFFPIKSAINQMSRWKDQLVSPEEALRTPARDTKGAIAAKVYAAYEKKLREAGAFDFDDLIYQTVQLLAEQMCIRDRA